MKKLLLICLFVFPVLAFAEEQAPYAWKLTGFGGGASLCTENGCFGPTGVSFGASFGRNMTSRWAFELEATVAMTSENEPPRFDPYSGLIYTPKLDRTRVWGGGHFLGSLASIGEHGDFFISVGFVGGYEQQTETVPEGVYSPGRLSIGVKGGVAGGAGMNLYFSDKWAFRPEVRYYLVAGNLSGLRYTGGILHKF